MSDYTIVKDFSATLGTILGSDLDAEFDAISTAVNSKVNSSGAGNAVLEVTVATFTPTWGAGFSSDPTGDLRYELYGDGTHDTVVIQDDTGAVMTGTSDANTMSFSGIPAGARPDATVFSDIFMLRDNTANTAVGIAEITAGGVCTFRMGIFTGSQWEFGGPGTGPSGGEDVFTTSGAKGLPAGWSMRYQRVVTA